MDKQIISIIHSIDNPNPDDEFLLRGDIQTIINDIDSIFLGNKAKAKRGNEIDEEEEEEGTSFAKKQKMGGTHTIHRQETLGACSSVLDQDRGSTNSRYNFFVEIWWFFIISFGYK